MFGFNKTRKTVEGWGVPTDASDIVAGYIVVIFWLYVIARVGYGLSDANEDTRCSIQSLSDVIVSPFYAIGCNLGKDRFLIKLN